MGMGVAPREGVAGWFWPPDYRPRRVRLANEFWGKSNERFPTPARLGKLQHLKKRDLDGAILPRHEARGKKILTGFSFAFLAAVARNGGMLDADRFKLRFSPMLPSRRRPLVTLASATILAGAALAYRWRWPAEREGLETGAADLAALR
jgi:hypothetical protein